jgi:hypothetical protein
LALSRIVEGLAVFPSLRIPPGGRSLRNTSTKFFQDVFGGCVKTNFPVKFVLKDLKLNVEIASKVHWQMFVLNEK